MGEEGRGGGREAQTLTTGAPNVFMERPLSEDPRTPESPSARGDGEEKLEHFFKSIYHLLINYTKRENYVSEEVHFFIITKLTFKFESFLGFFLSLKTLVLLACLLVISDK